MAEVTTSNKISPNAVESSILNITGNDALGKDTSHTNTNLAQTFVSNTCQGASSSKNFNSEDEETIIQKVFEDLDLGDISVLLGKIKNRRDRWAKIVLLFRRRMFLLLFMLEEMHKQALEDFIAKVPICRKYIFALLSCHCFQIASRYPNRFVALIYTCCFVYAVSKFFKERKRPEFEQFAPMCAQEIYKFGIRDELEVRRVIKTLPKYLEGQTAAELIDFASFMHTSFGASTTAITLMPEKIHMFRCDNVSCSKELIIKMELLVYYSQKLFPVEFNPKTRLMFSTLESEVMRIMNLTKTEIEELKRQRKEEAESAYVKKRKELEQLFALTHGNLFKNHMLFRHKRSKE